MVSSKKSSNPLDAHRKAARQKELKRNREQRDKVREARKEDYEKTALQYAEKRPRTEHDKPGESSRRAITASGTTAVQEESDDDDDGEDDDIAMPPGEAPPAEHDDTGSVTSEDSDGIVMPDGPPPLPPTGPRADRIWPPLPPGPVPPENFIYGIGQPGRPMPGPSAPRPQARPQYQQPPMAVGHGGQLQYTGPPPPLNPQQSMRPPPPGAHAQQGRPSAPTLPGPPPPRPSAVISAAPQLRDLKKEATAFVPPALRKKQAAAKVQAAKGGLPSAVNAAPGADESDEQTSDKVNLMDSLQSHLNEAQAQAGSTSSSTGRQDAKKSTNDDYERFLGEIGDLL